MESIKSWLSNFSTIDVGASSMLFSLIEMEEVNRLNPYEHMECLMDVMHDTDFINDSAKLDYLLLWST